MAIQVFLDSRWRGNDLMAKTVASSCTLQRLNTYAEFFRPRANCSLQQGQANAKKPLT